MTSKLVVNTIESDTGISSVSFASSISMSSTSKFFFSAAGIDIGADTNINRPAAGVLSFNINSAEKLRIDSNGHLNTSGIATASNFKTGSSNLHSTGLSVGNNFLHSTGINVGTGATIHVPATNTLTLGTNSSERLRITSGGKVLVNTTTASSVGNSTYSMFEVSGNTSGATGPGHLSLKRGTASASLSDGDTLSRLIFSSLDGGDFAYIQASVDGSPSGSDFPASLRFHTCADGASSSTERFRIVSDGRFGFGTSSPSDYALATFNSNNGIQIQGSTQARILLRDSGGGTNEKMMDIHCDSGNINFRTIADNYTTATTRATFRTDGNFVVGNRVGTSAPSTNQPVAFHSARVTPDTMTSTVSNGVRCNLYVGSNTGWAGGDGGVIGLGGSRSGYAGQEAVWAYIKGSRVSANGWEYAGKMELGTTEWGTYNMTKAVTLHADNQIDHHGKDNTMYSASIGGAVRVRLQHNGGGNMTLSNPSNGNFTFDTSSDYRLKENATTINNALTTVKALKPYQFTWKHDNKLGQGFFAHEAQEVLPDVGIVSGTKDAVQAEDDSEKGQWKKNDPIYQGIDYSKLVPLLTAALQEETAKREALEARVAALESS